MDIKLRESHGRWSWRRPRTWIIGLTVLVVVMATSVLLHFRHHLLWKYKLQPLIGRIEPVPVSPMPVAGPTPGWYRCRIGPLSLRLPPKLVEKGKRSAQGGAISFQDDDLIISIVMPRSDDSVSEALRVLNATSPNRHWSSYTQFRVDTYRADSDAFQWSMSSEEAREFNLRMATVFATRSSKHISVETRFDEEIEGLLAFDVDPRAVFSWQTTDGRMGAFMVIGSKNGPLDPRLVREICQSLQVDELGEVPATRSKQELLQILESIEAVPEE
ncbi:MAG: hypothetical protein EXS05_10120 [Planctomycetaceae bacterium]|nr:hypothetical protein [Planctomycetaceae bacterium]